MQKNHPICLDGAWRLYGFEEGSLSIHDPASLAASALQPIPAQVPGNVEIDLQRAGKLEDPFLGNNIFNLRPLERWEWWYERSFILPAETDSRFGWELVLDGLDCLATVWLNGELLGRTANALIPHRLPAGNALRIGVENTITIRIESAWNFACRQTYEANQMSWEHRWEGLRVRKAPHVWGWDIMPRAASAGIWRSVRLEPCQEHAFDWLYYWTQSVSAGPASPSATLSVRFQFHSTASVDDLKVVFKGACGDHAFSYEWPVEFNADGCQISIADARLWWPKGSGNPDLYTVTATLQRGDEILASNTQRIGLRTIKLRSTAVSGSPSEREPLSTVPARFDREADPAHHFFLEVNGEPVFAHGSNWVPLDVMHSRDLSRLDRAIQLAVSSGCNMLRCWGGNVYESDRFFDLCDENGLMVWQDFAFACCAYPQDEAFLSEVRREAEAIIPRLRNHASLALWCGDNENDMLYLSEGLDPQHNRLTREVIPQVLQRLDPQRSYLPGSPFYSPEALRQDKPNPEQHLWGPRGYYKSPFYTRHSAHFISEIGYHGCPSPESLREFLPADQLWPWDRHQSWQTHCVVHWRNTARERDRIRLMANQIKEVFGEIPDNLDDFAFASQFTQMEAKKYFIESTRLRKWQTSGILWWNLLDGWPQFSDAVVDYYYRRKLAWYAIRRAQYPVALIIGEAGSAKYLPLVLCNDTREAQRVTYKVWESGAGLLAEGEFTAPARQNWQIGCLRQFASNQRLLLLEWQVDGKAHGNHYLAGTPPFSLEQCKAWLDDIASLPDGFNRSDWA